MFECYDNIIGLAQEECACISTDRPADYATSQSGLYMDDLVLISSLVGLKDCDQTSIWPILTRARKAAISQFVADTNALMGQKYRPRRAPARDQVLGQIKAKTVESPTEALAVVAIECAPIRSGKMTISKLGAVFSGSGLVSVGLYNNVDGLLSTHEITTVADTYTTITLDLELPLYSKYCTPLIYYFVYTFDAGNLPRANKISCGCSGWTPTYNSAAPYYLDKKTRRGAPWASYVMVGGTEITDIVELEDTPSAMTSKMHGLVFEVDFSCDVSEVLCKDSLDFESNPLAQSMAFAIYYLTAALVASSVLSSDKLTRSNMINSEDWEDSLIEWQAKYNEHTNYIASQANYTANDCLTCRDVLGMTTQGLFS